MKLEIFDSPSVFLKQFIVTDKENELVLWNLFCI